ncbi:hypothetical protein K9K77_01755 [Candidatus Babeliales bacterium]|nr:hypothetical protein [Candidatus Babeliales bacterium]
MDGAKFLLFLFIFFSTHCSYGVETKKIILTQTHIEQFAKEGKQLNLSWCACKAFPEHVRIVFTEQLIHLYSKNYSKNKNLVITFFASGYLFLQEYTILRALHCNGFKQITPYFIDPVFSNKDINKKMSQFKEIVRQYPSIQEPQYFISAEEYLRDQTASKTDILTTIDIKDPLILEEYQNIREQKMNPQGRSVCTYSTLLTKIEDARKEQKLVDIQKAFTTDIDF